MTLQVCKCFITINSEMNLLLTYFTGKFYMTQFLNLYCTGLVTCWFCFAFCQLGGLNLDIKIFSLGKNSAYLDTIDFELNDNANKDNGTCRIS